VVSLLAVGTLCWWQRTPGPINAPRPQDEAEIMTAVLERHYAMGRENVYFGVSNTIGFFPNAPQRYATAMRTAYMGRWLQALDPSIWGGAVDLGTWRYKDWSWPRFTLEFKTEEWAPASYKNTGWIIPSTNYMTTCDMSWFDTETPHTNIFSGPINQFVYTGAGPTYEALISAFFQSSAAIWTNYITLPIATWRTSTNYQSQTIFTQVVGSVTNVITNTLHSTTNYINTGFREDPYFSRTAHNRPASMKMAWERNLQYREVVDNGRQSLAQDQARDAPVFWSTNVYRDFGRALSVLQWVRDVSPARTNITWYSKYWTEDGTAYSTNTITTNFNSTQPNIGYSFSTLSGGRTNSEAWGTTVFYAAKNTTSFNIDTYQFQVVGTPINTNAPAYTNARPATIPSISSGAIEASQWWPWTPDGPLQSFVDDFARTNSKDSGAAIRFSANIPYDCYHVQFTALTNYLDHAPAR